MSELGDKERRFVEDQRRVDYHEELQTLKEHIDAAAEAEDDEWKSEMLAANATMLRMWLLEGVQDLKQKVRKQDALLAEKTAEIARWHAECHKVGVSLDPEALVRHHRANERLTVEADRQADKILLAEAAEVLRALIDVTPTFKNSDGQLVCSYCGTICEGTIEHDDFDDDGLREGETDCPWVQAKVFLLDKLGERE